MARETKGKHMYKLVKALKTTTGAHLTFVLWKGSGVVAAIDILTSGKCFVWKGGKKSGMLPNLNAAITNAMEN